MKKMQLPYHKKMKQTTLQSFTMKKKNAIHEIPISKLPKSCSVTSTYENSKDHNAIDFMKNNEFSHNINLCDPSTFCNISSELLKPVKSEILQSQCSTSHQLPCIISQYSFVSNDSKTDISDKNKENFIPQLPQNVCNESYSDNLLSDNENHSWKDFENADNNSVTVDSLESSGTYDLTMRFVPDSLGNQIFDHFSQKVARKPNVKDNLFTDSEKDFYQSFEKDLIHKNLCQSTQKF